MDTSISIKGYSGNSARSFRVSVHLVELAGIEFFPQFQMLQFLSSCLAAGRSKLQTVEMLQNLRPGTPFSPTVKWKFQIFAKVSNIVVSLGSVPEYLVDWPN